MFKGITIIVLYFFFSPSEGLCCDKTTCNFFDTTERCDKGDCINDTYCKYPFYHQTLSVYIHLPLVNIVCLKPVFHLVNLFARTSECDWLMMTSVFVASQSSCFFLCSREQIRLVENRLKASLLFATLKIL